MKKLALLLLSLISVFFLAAQTPGTLDFSFGNNGIRLVDFGGSNNHNLSSAIQPDQKIVMAGYTYNTSKDMSFARLNSDGDLDPGFGSGGIITPVFGGSDEQISGVLVQPDGFIVGTGYTFDGTESAMIVTRLTPIGLLDPSFSNDGMVTIDFGFIDDSWGESIALQDDGKIIVAGQVRDLLFDLQCGIARINPDGSLDNSFGTNGVVIRDILSMDNYINNVAMQGDKIVVGGMSYDGDDFYITIARFTTEGIADPSFGVNGHISTLLQIDPTIISSIGSMCIDSENRILFGIYSMTSGESDMAIYRYLPDGDLDPDFGTMGMQVVALPGNNITWAITTQYDNKIIATGWSDEGGTPIVRLLENGSPDPDFGSEGTGIVFNGAVNIFNSLKIQDDGLIIASGEASNGTDQDFVATRYFSGLNVGIENTERVREKPIIYPNPALDHINIAIPSGEEIKGVSIYNTIGVEQIQMKESFGKIDISSLPKGTYFIEVRLVNTIRVATFIKTL